MKYHEFIKGINEGIIKKVSFSITDYHHYRNCIVEVQLVDPNRFESGRIIWFYLTSDGYEKKGFLNKIKENTKLFYLKNKGSFTLKQIWNKVEINSIEYVSDTNIPSINS